MRTPPGLCLGGVDHEPGLERRRVVEIAAALSLPIPPLDAVAVAALAGAFDLGGGELEGGADPVGLHLGHERLSPCWRSRPVTMIGPPWPGSWPVLGLALPDVAAPLVRGRPDLEG
jgi:hypothetical protein